MTHFRKNNVSCFQNNLFDSGPFEVILMWAFLKLTFAKAQILWYNRIGDTYIQVEPDMTCEIKPVEDPLNKSPKTTLNIIFMDSGPGPTS